MLRTRPRLREVLVALVLTPLYLLCRGYVFGTRDHAIHLAYIERMVDPGFLAGDPLLEVAAHHPSFFFAALAGLSRLVPLEALYFAGHVLSVFAMILGLRALARRLWDGPAGEWAAAVAVAGAFVHRYVAGSIENLDAMFLPRVASLGPLLWALELGVRGRFGRAFALTGAVFLVHAPTAAHTAFVLWVGCAFGGRANLRHCLLGPVLFLAAASPLLFWMAVHGGPEVPSPAPVEWVQSLKLHHAFHHFAIPWIPAGRAAAAAMAILLGVAVSRWRGAGALLAGFLAGAAGLIVAGGIGNWGFSWPVTIHLHLFEAGRLLDYLAVVALGRWSYSVFHGPWPTKAVGVLILAAYALRIPLHEWVRHRFVPDFYVLAAALAVTLLVRREFPGRRRLAAHRLGGILRREGLRPPPRRQAGGFAAGLGAALVVVSVAAGRMPEWNPTGAGYPGYRMMRWARDHLPAEAVVIVPPYIEGAIPTFRHFARRRVVGSWKDGGEGTFNHAFQLSWEQQVRDISGVGASLRVPDGPVNWADYAAWIRGAVESYHTMPAEHFIAMGRRYGASHVVRQAGALRIGLPVLYEDEEYVLQELPDPGARR
ncbi:MAG: hypothetical protein JXQ29_02235 [Planctomycetes bacterium]|nr:hypothetical protein [Planctomycetota bacterium]